MLQFQGLASDQIAGYRMLGRAVLDESARSRFPSINGVAISEKQIHVLMEKESSDEIAALRRLTSIAFDPLFIGPIVPAAQGGDSLQASGGSRTPGTFGCLVRDAAGKIFALTSDHVAGVLARQTKGMAVLSPIGGSSIGGFDSGSGVSLSVSASNQVDAALIDLTAPSGHSSKIHGLGKPMPAIAPVALNDAVEKYGQTTGHTTGTVKYFMTFLMPYGAGSARFIDQIGIESLAGPFAGGGDSGSVIMRKGEAIGLLMGTGMSGHLAFANDMDQVLAALGVALA